MDHLCYYRTVNLLITVSLGIPDIETAGQLVYDNLAAYLDQDWAVKGQTLIMQVYQVFQDPDARAKLAVQGFKVLLTTEMATNHPEPSESVVYHYAQPVETSENNSSDVYYMLNSDGVTGEGVTVGEVANLGEGVTIGCINSLGEGVTIGEATNLGEDVGEAVNVTAVPVESRAEHNISENTEMELASTPRANQQNSTSPEQVQVVELPIEVELSAPEIFPVEQPTEHQVPEEGTTSHQPGSEGKSDSFLRSWSNNDISDIELALLLSRDRLPELRQIYSTINSTRPPGVLVC